MSVYTHLTFDEIAQLLTKYDIGTLKYFEGIAAGVENTNYFIDVVATDSQTTRYVLTLFEFLPVEIIPFFTTITDHLATQQLPVPLAIRDLQGVSLHWLKNKPCLIQRCLAGKQVDTPNSSHCAAVGEMLGKMHQAGLQTTISQTNQRGLSWLVEQADRLQSLVSTENAALLKQQADFFTAFFQQHSHLPQGIIHGDLFHDNVLFTNTNISGVIDFYNACTDYLLYDLAVTANDWCRLPGQTLDPQKVKALVDGYNHIRPFNEDDKNAWPVMLQFAAFRFWVSRIITFEHPEEHLPQNEDAVVKPKDPNEFKQLMLHHKNNPGLYTL
ncbi:homoserine kinase [Endozoicomonas sp. SM1973]|uniref:Homoserine kinase n=1 Tax=Spartinivicinus marinus TaxID=2994442 RepID=A0A853I617_9GAMM|nr:homoserine kinase [Spartinivicinus marinus]MCX4027056.1 homoserine kinase [Spartinivicinus marinus]NYZ67052.1 homoserine kinase [Spartinivicinus marinus]